MKRLRSSALHGETESESVLLNLLLRNFLHHNLFEQAEKLISKSTFPEQANNNEWARFLYYTGRIKAIQLEYSDAQKTITNGNCVFDIKNELRFQYYWDCFGIKFSYHRPVLIENS